jgi:serine/threonine protein kinase
MYCPQCSTELPDDSKFCSKCGYDFVGIKTMPPAKKLGRDSMDGLGTSIGADLDDYSFKVGTLFANRYEVLTEGYKGGMGTVYKCRDTKLNEIVALKIIHPRLLSSPQVMSRFRQEVSISRKLQHPNIVSVFNLEESEGKEYFTMEWIEGVTLREIIKRRRKGSHPFSLDEANKIIGQISDALSDAHKHTIHRDIKPENILVSDEKDLRVKLSDFGIAKMLNPSQFTSTSMQMGTPYYMAPEQKVDAGNIDKRADIYALGVVLFELLTLENTMGLELPSEINKNLPSAIDNIIKKAVATNPDYRYGDAKELSDALNAISVATRRQKETEILDESRRQKQANLSEIRVTSTSKTPSMELDRKLRGKRSVKYVESIAQLDAGEKVLNTGPTQLAQLVMDAVREEFQGIDVDQQLIGIVGKCTLESFHDVHCLDVDGLMIKHYKAAESLPPLLTGARSLANHGAYAFIEVYSDGMRAVKNNGSVSVIKEDWHGRRT